MKRSGSRELASLLPHGPEARWVSRVTDITLDTVRCEGRVPARCPYVRGGRCPAYVALELAAQVAAILEAQGETLETRRSRRIGYLVRARRVFCERPDFPADALLRAHVSRIGESAPVFVYEADVSDSDGRLLRGEITTYVIPR
jgi:predicted hotdog family 3-hydroxylacyl-ACP dehydratase